MSTGNPFPSGIQSASAEAPAANSSSVKTALARKAPFERTLSDGFMMDSFSVGSKLHVPILPIR